MIDFPGLMANDNVQAFLALIRYTEGADYRTLFGGEKITSLADHPRRYITKKLGSRQITSSAAGAYQFLSRTWDECAKALSLPDFSPASQDTAALFLINRRQALRAVLSADFTEAIRLCNKEWASLPGSPYGQPTKTLAACLDFLDRRLGPDPLPAPVVVPPSAEEFTQPLAIVSTPHEGDSAMLPFIAAAIPALIQAAPSLIRIFGNGDQSDKNAKAAETVAEIARSVTNSETTEGAVAALQADPVMASAFSAAIEEKWYTLTGEAGGGGIDGARRADRVASESSKPWMSPALLVAGALIPLVYMVVAAVLFGVDWTIEIKAMVVSSIISLVLGSITGFFLGTSYGSQRKTDIIAAGK